MAKVGLFQKQTSLGRGETNENAELRSLVHRLAETGRSALEAVGEKLEHVNGHDSGMKF